MSELPTLVPYLKVENGEPYLEGSRCGNCGHIFLGTRDTCAKCTARGQMATIRLAETGKLYNYTIVKRSFPGIETPFVDAIIDLDDGAHIKANLVDVEPDPDALPYDMPVRVVFREVAPIGAKDQPYLSYFFAPIDTGNQEGTQS